MEHIGKGICRNESANPHRKPVSEGQGVEKEEPRERGLTPRLSIVDTRSWYRRNVSFPRKGIDTIEIFFPELNLYYVEVKAP